MARKVCGCSNQTFAMINLHRALLWILELYRPLAGALYDESLRVRTETIVGTDAFAYLYEYTRTEHKFLTICIWIFPKAIFLSLVLIPSSNRIPESVYTGGRDPASTVWQETRCCEGDHGSNPLRSFF